MNTHKNNTVSVNISLTVMYMHVPLNKIVFCALCWGQHHIALFDRCDVGKLDNDQTLVLLIKYLQL